ncbi:hypothetical protein GCM10007973_05050 [Polymorphobacter multimanifer]|uniref:Rod shape-determining protein MreD n=1 Tax=Polymorphobacter multimanifer TaxID=1070431 RepID=A0A841L4W2_9SPHN|nr:hypothetical protein [Polymorphobacter multimanifer]MBB6227664.1 rod shape-determining protein MreD [Polymorphobacter multimanifer]GGI71051.1 hypothetical protein GCM10007973_05050 [Polymorphobacter multimanifer]
MRGPAPPLRLMNPRERRSFWLGHWRLGLPALAVLGLLLLATAPLPLSLPLMPPLGLLGVFVWATFQPGLMPPWLAFLLGLVADLLLSMPFGVNATLFAAVAGFVRWFEVRYGHHAHGFDWAMAVAITAVHALLTIQLMALASHPVPLEPLAWQWLTSLFAYPAVVALCGWLQRAAFGARTAT